MNDTLLQKLDRQVRASVPFLVSLAFVLVAAAPWSRLGGTAMVPWPVLIAVTYWSIYRPDRLPYWSVFILGLVEDAIGWGPFGQTALVLLVVRAILVSQRKVFRGKSFLLIWAAFAAVALVACSLVWVTTMIYAWSALSPAPAVAQWMASVAAYPPAAWLLGQIHALALRRQ
ncbi:MAG: rod shape-determining protein MreD [Tistrella sp.]|uniref:Rod shape-determining protein MreD n=1 Tax=Tistrella mobilis TaxID=171437 RepID=A0A3B9IRP2_9PROT|nr:rod shape-determining protein MreD [Tistrella sp.]MAD37474.1 rod shape-determining protein MreD [Tistrella sp.]MBA74469.1 rod shape-determining protein MreD [Tistrella sp.]HAE50420.1 rod shape-determining protein MreD [Tistrella mobilis]|tara:strand:+ start:436 stop:951 length:516 start_codon:yes stop_codon:yes gene_type:complete